MVEDIKIKNFIVFEKFEMECSQGLNVIIGENGTGKTHFLKLISMLIGSDKKIKTKKFQQYFRVNEPKELVRDRQEEKTSIIIACDGGKNYIVLLD